MLNTSSRRISETPFRYYIENAGVKSYTVYNRTYLATIFDNLENDYLHLNKYVQIWDVSCQKQIQISGNDSSKLIQKITPRDLREIKIGKCYYIPVSDPKGKILNDPILIKISDDVFRLSLSDSDLMLWLMGLLTGLKYNVKLENLEIYTIAIQGPLSQALMEKVFGSDICKLKHFDISINNFSEDEVLISRTGFSSTDGFEIYISDINLCKPIWEKLFEKGVELNIKVGCPNLIDRIEGGLLSYGNDINIFDSVLESGLLKFCNINSDIDCLGINSIRNEYKNGIKKLIKYFLIDSNNIGICNKPWSIMIGDNIIGQITSSAFSPLFKKNVAIGMIDTKYTDKDNYYIKTESGKFYADMFSKPLKSYRKL